MAAADSLTNDIRHEANTALLEIDKGLHSLRVGEQCEAIVKFPVLIDRFPFPVVINSAFLKIAEIFRTGNNFIRLNIYKVLQLTEKHLSKITSVDEFIRRIYSVMHSNASIARAVTLRVFGSIACIVTERKNIHHSIHHGLESTNKVEVDAAVHATMCLCRHSRTFAMGVCDRIMSMIEGLTTPESMKLQLFPILSLMNHDINTATQVRELCIKLLPAYPSLCFVTAILHTLTELAIGTLIHVQDQVKLLLFYAGEDARHLVRMKALGNLSKLASQLPHAWTQAMIQDFYCVMAKASSNKEKMSCAQLLYELADSLAVHNMVFLKDDAAFQSLCYSPCPTVSACAMGVVSHIVVTATEAKEEKKMEELEEVAAVIMEALLVCEQNEGDGQSRAALKVLLSSLTLLTSSCPSLSESVLDTLLGVLPNLTGVEAVLVCRCLASIAAHSPGTWSHVSPTLLDYLNDKTEQHHRIIVPVSTVLMELHQGDSVSEERLNFRELVCPRLLSHVLGLQHPSRLWACYQVARRASRMGFHELAESLYLRLSTTVTTVKFRNWLKALYQFSLSQAVLCSSTSSPSSTAGLVPALARSSSIVYNAMFLIKMAEVSSSFPENFLRVYSSCLNAHYQLLVTSISFYTLPPPSGNYSSSFFEKKLRACVSQFQAVSQQCSELYSSLFDADLSTLDYVSLLQQSCMLMASVISSIGLSRKPLVSPGKVTTPIAETPVGQVEISDSFNTSYLLGKACRSVFHNSQMTSSSVQSLPFGDKHVAALIESSRTILQVPIQLPKYFFNSSQLTSVKLALSPTPPTGEGHLSVTLSPNTHLTMQVEGVVEHSGPELYRSPAAVYIKVSPVLDTPHSTDTKPPALNSLERMEKVEKDYFEAQFLLDLSVPGVYSILVKASLLDEEGRVWHIGQRAKMTVLVEGGEEPAKGQAKQRESGSQTVASSSSSSKLGSSQSRI